MTDAPTESPAPKPAPPPHDDAARQARRFMVGALTLIIGILAVAILGILLNSPDAGAPPASASPVASPPTAAPSTTATDSTPSTIPAPESTALPTATTTGQSPAATQTPAGNGELDGTIVDAVRASGLVSVAPDFAGATSIVVLMDNLPPAVRAGLVQRFSSGDEFTYVTRYYLLPDATSARDLARSEAGFPTQFVGAQTIDDRDVPGGACVTVVVLEEVVSRCYVLRGRVAAIVEILGPAAARDHILDAGVILAGYTREILVRAIDD